MNHGDARDPTATPEGETAEDGVVEQRIGADQGAVLKPHDVHSYIGRQLQAVYDDIAKQPIPDRFLALMQELEAKTASK